MTICGCLTERNAEDCIRVGKSLHVDIVEHRIDFMHKIERLEEIYSATSTPILATNKSLENKGRFQGTGRERVRYLSHAIDAGAKLVDIELEARKDLRERIIRKAKRAQITLLIDMHDHYGTPSIGYLVDTLKKQIDLGADIAKIVTTSNSQRDNETILSLYNHANGFPLIAFAMGEIGKPTRKQALERGAPFMYASINQKAAPGQYTVREMRAAGY